MTFGLAEPSNRNSSDQESSVAEVWLYQLQEDALVPTTAAELIAALEAGRYKLAARCPGPALRPYRHPMVAAFWHIRRREETFGIDWLPGSVRRGGIAGDLFAYVSPTRTVSVRVLSPRGQFVKCP